MEFEAYFKATETAFAQEKEASLYKIEQLKSQWTDVQEIDNAFAERVKSMLEVKKLLSKSHLQILRTKEECIQMQLKNAQLRFHVRQLQNEIFRLLPYSHTQVPSTEYIMSLDREILKPSQHTSRSEADEEHIKEITELHGYWVNLTELQRKVFNEEMQHYNDDQAQWEKFSRSVQNTNDATHNLINSMMCQITRSYSSLQREHEELVKKDNALIAELEKKISKLTNKSQTLLKGLNERKDQDRKKTSVEASKITKEMKRRVKTIETKNNSIIDDLQEENDELYDREDFLLDDIDDLKEKIKKYEKENGTLSKQGEEKISKLEAELNAIISAASAIEDVDSDQHLAIIGAVSAAVGKHAEAATNAERVIEHVDLLQKKFEKEFKKPPFRN